MTECPLSRIAALRHVSFLVFLDIDAALGEGQALWRTTVEMGPRAFQVYAYQPCPVPESLGSLPPRSWCLRSSSPPFPPALPPLSRNTCRCFVIGIDDGLSPAILWRD